VIFSFLFFLQSDDGFEFMNKLQNLCLQMTYLLVQKMVQKCGLPIRYSSLLLFFNMPMAFLLFSCWFIALCRGYQEHIVRLQLWRHTPSVRLSHVTSLKKHSRFI